MLLAATLPAGTIVECPTSAIVVSQAGKEGPPVGSTSRSNLGMGA